MPAGNKIIFMNRSDVIPHHTIMMVLPQMIEVAEITQVHKFAKRGNPKSKV